MFKKTILPILLFIVEVIIGVLILVQSVSCARSCQGLNLERGVGSLLGNLLGVFVLFPGVFIGPNMREDKFPGSDAEKPGKTVGIIISIVYFIMAIACVIILFSLKPENGTILLIFDAVAFGFMGILAPSHSLAPSGNNSSSSTSTVGTDYTPASRSASVSAILYDDMTVNMFSKTIGQAKNGLIYKSIGGTGFETFAETSYENGYVHSSTASRSIVMTYRDGKIYRGTFTSTDSYGVIVGRYENGYIYRGSTTFYSDRIASYTGDDDAAGALAAWFLFK